MTGTTEKTFQCRGVLTFVKVSPDGRMLACGSTAGTVWLWDLPSGKLLKTHEIGSGSMGWVTGLAFSPQSNRLAASTGSGALYVWNTTTPECAVETRTQMGRIRNFEFNPAGTQLFLEADPEIVVWDIVSAQAVRRFEPHNFDVGPILLSPDGQTLFTTDASGKRVHLWDASTFELKTVLQCQSSVYGLALLPEESRLAMACHDNTIRLWDLARAEEVAVLRGHTDSVRTLDFSPDGTQLVSVSDDTTVRVWDTLPAQARAMK